MARRTAYGAGRRFGDSSQRYLFYRSSCRRQGVQLAGFPATLRGKLPGHVASGIDEKSQRSTYHAGANREKRKLLSFAAGNLTGLQLYEMAKGYSSGAPSRGEALPGVQNGLSAVYSRTLVAI